MYTNKCSYIMCSFERKYFHYTYREFIIQDKLFQQTLTLFYNLLACYKRKHRNKSGRKLSIPPLKHLLHPNTIFRTSI